MKADNEGDKKAKRRRLLQKKSRGARIAIGENFSPFNFFSSYIYILGCRRCLVAPDTIVHRPWTCLFDCKNLLDYLIEIELFGEMEWID